MPPEPEKTEDKPAGDSPDREPPFFSAGIPFRREMQPFGPRCLIIGRSVI